MLDVTACKSMMVYVADGIISNEAMLTEADKMGDADHGSGMAVGFSKVKETLAAQDASDVAGLFKSCGTSIMMSSGGASGVIFGTVFRDGAQALNGRSELDSEGFSLFLDSAVKGVMERGKASPGDKTMVDALYPAAEAARGYHGNDLGEVMKAAYEAAKTGSDQTAQMIAKFGRMRSLGARTYGYVDPGSITMYLILQYMYEFISHQNN